MPPPSAWPTHPTAAALLPASLPRSYAFSVWFPLHIQLRKELGELLVGMGLVGAALAVFEQLELWDNLIVCYQLLDKRVQVCVGLKGGRGGKPGSG